VAGFNRNRWQFSPEYPMSYTIDIYKKKFEPTKDFIAFSAFVSFFPQLVAGPIERASNLLPQFYTKRLFNYSKSIDGLRQILWGLFKKIVIADNCAKYANLIFNNSANYSGSTLIIGALFFSFQIYGDFSGYSDIAIGTSRLFGFSLMRNFAFPYFSRDIAEFWRRWHISLSTWFRDYIFIPLGGSKVGTWVKVRNIFVIFIVSGFWHGANWTFVVWGALNAVYFLPLMILNKNRNNLKIVAQGKLFPTIKEVSQMLLTFILVVFAWIFFRAENIKHALSYLSIIFSKSTFTVPYFDGRRGAVVIIILVVIFLFIEWFGREKQYAIAEFSNNWPKSIRIGFYYSLIIAVFYFGGSGPEFIYFQF
jgi:alginate O-acetyltransferase complex protein AlgI